MHFAQGLSLLLVWGNPGRMLQIHFTNSWPIRKLCFEPDFQVALPVDLEPCPPAVWGIKNFLRLVRKQNFEANGGNSSQFGHSFLHWYSTLCFLIRTNVCFLLCSFRLSPCIFNFFFFSHLTLLCFNLHT